MRVAVLILFVISNFVVSASIDTSKTADFINYPALMESWDYSIAIGASVTSLPIEVVEEEINRSPIIRFDSRLGLPARFSTSFRFYSNYLVNSGTLGFDFNLFDSKASANLGVDGSMWFGHLNLDAIQLKARGLTVSPNLSLGVRFEDLLLSSKFEVQFASIWTDDGEEAPLGRKRYPDKGLAMQLNLEQPLWNNNWTLLALKLNYTKFYYQTWLSYNSLDEYLLYPEIIFAFVL